MDAKSGHLKSESKSESKIHNFIWLKYEHVSAIEGAPDSSSEGTPTFDVEIKVVLEVTIELHLKMHMVVHLLVQKSSQKNSIKGELEEAFYVALERVPKTSR